MTLPEFYAFLAGGSLSAYIGHSSISTTSDIYRHLLPDAHQTDAAKLSALLA